jgi:hypothetical protein
MRLEDLGNLKKSNDLIGNRTLLRPAQKKTVHTELNKTDVLHKQTERSSIRNIIKLGRLKWARHIECT